MSKTTALNLFLLIIVAALANLIYFSEAEDTRLENLSTLDISSIKKITIKHNAHTTAINKNKNKNDHWTITRPVEIGANEFRINSILKLANAPVHSQYSLDDIDLDDIGLNQPTTAISFNDHTIAFGITNPATGLRYVQFDNKIYTIEDVYYPLISSHFGALISLNLLPTNSKVRKLILINQTIARDDKGLWQSNITISADNIAKTIDNWQSKQAFGVHEYLEREALGDVFVYTDAQEDPVSYLITDVDPWLIIARPELGLEYHLDIEAYDQLIAPQ